MKIIKMITCLFCEISIAVLVSGCHMLVKAPETSKAAVTNIVFAKNAIELENGESTYIKYNVTPAALQNQVSASWEYDTSIISIDPDKYGVVINAIKSGQTFLKATLNGITTTCLITVKGNPDIFEGEPYIYSNFSVVQLTPGSNSTVSVSLYGGTASDAEDFVWEILDNTIADISYARGNCVVTAKKKGSTQLKVSHRLCTYSYSMVVYVYTDDLSECYLTTAQNVVLINKATTPSRSITVNIKNPASQNYQSGFHYQFINDDGTNATDPCATIVGNGNLAVITPIKNGIAKLRVTHQMSEYPLDIMIKVTTTVQNTYIVPSCTTLIVKGSDTAHSVYADVVGTDAYVNPEKFVWEILENESGPSAASCMDWEVNGNCIAITGKKNGAFKIKVSHELSEYSRTILVVLREQMGSALDASMYITTTSNFVQTKVGNPATKVEVSIVGGKYGDENDLQWKIENGENNDICKIVTPTGRIMARSIGSVTNGSVYITPKKEGTAKISVSHPKIAYATDIIIKVASEYAILEEPVYINTENSVVKMLNGTTKEITTTLSGNISVGDENGITWKSSDSAVISVSPSTGKTTIFSANGHGNNQTYVSIKHSKALAEKKVLVLSADNQTSLDAMKGFYADTTYFRVEEGSSCTLEMKQFGLSSTDIQNITWTTEKPSLCIVSADPDNHLKATVNGISRGHTKVKASLAGAKDCVFDITVCPIGEEKILSVGYFTTTKNAVVISKVGDTAELTVTGVNIKTDDVATKTVWQAENPAIVSTSYSGNRCTLTALDKGKTKIKISNPESKNILYIDVKVGALYEWTDDYNIYITTEEDTVTMVKGQTKTIGAALENSTATGGFSWSVTGKTGICNIVGSASGTCIIEAVEAGMTEITIRNSNTNLEKQILVAVSNTPEELAGIKHLTTDQNVISVGETYNATVRVSVKNAKEDILDGYHWLSNDPATVDVVASGAVAVFYGKRQGSTKVIVTNDQCEFPLEIIVNVVDPVAASKNPYITCQNIVTLNVGDAATTLTADLIGGTAADYANFSWHIQNPSVASLYASNETAQIKALSQGVTQLIISHPKAGGIDRNVLVICEPASQTNCYITVTESIIKMSPGDSPKTITATLINGTESDKYNFKWWADSYDIIDMNYTGESAVITPVGSGVVTIHCSHPKSPYQKDIILYISQFSEFAFANKSISLTKGIQSFVNMQVPAMSMATKIAYSVRKPDGNTASDLLHVSGTNSVCILDPLKEGNCVVTAKLIAVNSGITQGSCELLVNIVPSSENVTYINYAGSTIINIEKGENISLRATLAGENALIGDEKFLKWKSSDPSIVKISPSPSASGWTTNNEVQLTGLAAGKECTVTISHSKANNDIILYCIVPGENVANILLDRTAMNLIQGSPAQFLSANITNAAENDYNNLRWTVQQDETNPVVILSGSGKKISVLPKNIGSAIITATVPSSLRKATCTVKVEEPKTLKVSMKSVSIYPGEVYKLSYSVSPESETNSVKWTFSDSAFCGIVEDDHKGNLTIYGKAREGIATITGTTKSMAQAQITVNNSWGNTFSISKSLLKTIPVDNGDGTFNIDFTIKPSCAEIRIKNMPENIILKDGTYESYSTVAGMNNVYRITKEYFTEINNETGIAKGTIRLVPKGEAIRDVVIEAYNPTVVNGQPIGIIESKNLSLKVYHNSYTFNLTTIDTPQSNFSRFDRNAGALILGDGERLTFSVAPLEKNATPLITSVTVKTQLKDTDTYKGKPYTISNATSKPDIHKNIWTLKLIDDVTSDEVDKKYNTSTIDFINIGSLEIKYRSALDGDSEKTYNIPLYLEVRNCAYNYGK